MSSIKIDHKTLKKFTFDILCSTGVDPKEATIIAGVFVWCDLFGRYTQGIWRIPVYIRRFKKGLISSPCNYKIEQKSEVMALIDGNSAFGQYIGHVAMSMAINLAEQFGVGVVGVKRSNHWGAGAYYVELAAKRAQLGFAFSNAVPHVSAYGGIPPVIGTNPFAFGAPTRDGHSVLVDFSTGSSAGSMIMKAKEEGKSIPEGIIIDDQGNSITDPNLASNGTVLPFGGAKGFCLGLLVEILSGVITGAGVSHEIASLHNNFERISNVGHLFISIDISKFIPMDFYYDRMSRLINIIKASKTMTGFDEVLIPGETRWRYFDDQSKNGIRLDKKTVESLSKLAEDLKVRIPW
ncbi:MAG: Ldh family oxidoreductase [Bacteroidetes bacterium]|nr:Ldh family oxidoreductase [Bacteroidota bacterium]